MTAFDESRLPLYKCHKEVRALKIAGYHFDGDGPVILPDDPRFPPFRVSLAYMQKHQPKAGGYYVLYADGYESFSPAKAFEDGYTLVG